jgi:hypothetical protein
MRKFLNGRRPSPALIIAVVALVAALSGTAVAAKKLSLGALSDGAKNKTVGVGKLTYVTNTVNPPAGQDTTVTANCPAGQHVLGGGIKVADTLNDFIDDTYPTVSGWAAVVDIGTAGNHVATITAICGVSRVVTGAPPTS